MHYTYTTHYAQHIYPIQHIYIHYIYITNLFLYAHALQRLGRRQLGLQGHGGVVGAEHLSRQACMRVYILHISHVNKI